MLFINSLYMSKVKVDFAYYTQVNARAENAA
jgi:hypothetical protein